MTWRSLLSSAPIFCNSSALSTPQMISRALVLAPTAIGSERSPVSRSTRSVPSSASNVAPFVPFSICVNPKSPRKRLAASISSTLRMTLSTPRIAMTVLRAKDSLSERVRQLPADVIAELDGVVDRRVGRVLLPFADLNRRFDDQLAARPAALHELLEHILQTRRRSASSSDSTTASSTAIAAPCA